jgi:hypothetical protein
MGLPVLGREEDAADSYAITALIKVATDASHDVLIQATKGWFLKPAANPTFTGTFRCRRSSCATGSRRTSPISIAAMA